MSILKRVDVMVFPGAHNLPLWVIQHVCPDLMTIHYTKSRDEQFAAFNSGAVQIIHTAPDNLWMPDAADCAPFMGGTVGELSLIANEQWEQTKRLAVDNPDSGFALLAYQWIAQHTDIEEYQIIPSGGTDGRFAALKTDAADAAVMHPPFTQLGVKLGFRVLGRVDEGVTTLVGVCRVHEVAELWVREYRELYRMALELLQGESGQVLAAELVREHLGGAGGAAEAVADSMRRQIVKEGVELNWEQLNRLREVRARHTAKLGG